MLPIFTKRKRKDGNAGNCRFVGGYVPSYISSFISLASMSSGKSRSEILREVMDDWISKIPAQSVSEMHDNLSKVAIEKCNRMSRKKRNLPVFLCEVEKELRPFLDKETISVILKKVKDGAKDGAKK
jgi:hypothetical protein